MANSNLNLEHFGVTVELAELETRTKKAGGEYQVQKAYFHSFDNKGKPKRYPEEINLFPPRDPVDGKPRAYPPGEYTLAPQSLRVSNGFLELAFPVLQPLKK